MASYLHVATIHRLLFGEPCLGGFSYIGNEIALELVRQGFARWRHDLVENKPTWPSFVELELLTDPVPTTHEEMVALVEASRAARRLELEAGAG